MHYILENIIGQRRLAVYANNGGGKDIFKMANTIKLNAFPRIQEVYGLEIPLYYQKDMQVEQMSLVYSKENLPLWILSRLTNLKEESGQEIISVNYLRMLLHTTSCMAQILKRCCSSCALST